MPRNVSENVSDDDANIANNANYAIVLQIVLPFVSLVQELD
jgi:hypothetical protein